MLPFSNIKSHICFYINSLRKKCFLAILNAIFLVLKPKITQFNFELHCDYGKSFTVWAFYNVLCQGQTQELWVSTLLLPTSMICKAEGARCKELLLEKNCLKVRFPLVQNAGCCSSLWVHVNLGSRRSPALISTPIRTEGPSGLTCQRPNFVGVYEFTLGYQHVKWFLTMYMFLNFTYPLQLQALCQFLLALLRCMESGNQDQGRESALLKRDVCACKTETPLSMSSWFVCLSLACPRSHTCFGNSNKQFQMVTLL